MRNSLPILGAAVLWFAFAGGMPCARAGETASTLAGKQQVLVENRHMTIKDGFGAQFWLTDSDRFFLNWVKTDTRNLTPLLAVRRGIPINLAIFIVDPGVKKTLRPDGTIKLQSDITYDFMVFRPDGSAYPAAGGRDITGLTGRPSSQHMVTLLYGKPSWTFDQIDDPGEYTVQVVVHDKIRDVHIPLKRKLWLQE